MPAMPGCGGGTCGIQKHRAREQQAALRSIARAYPGLVRSPSPVGPSPVGLDRIRSLGHQLEQMLPVRALPRPAEHEGGCDWLYLLAGIHPGSLLELADGLPDDQPLRDDETYVRLGFSPLGPFVTLQECRLRLERAPPVWLVHEEPRVGIDDTRLSLIVKGLQGALREARLVVLDAAFLTAPLDGACWPPETPAAEPPTPWSFLFEPEPPGAGRVVCFPEPAVGSP
jgi:hypothetical protein